MLSGRRFWSGYAVVVKRIRREYRENSDGKIGKNVSKPSGEFNVCMGGDDGRYGWLGLPRGTEPPAVIAISLRDLSSIKHAQQSLMTSGAGSSVIRQSKTF
jgi:hypothetical protein